MKAEILLHHKYFRILAHHTGVERGVQILASFHILTVETIFMFTIALCYDIESPSDDGTCQGHISEEVCLMRRSITDSTSSYCAWDTVQGHCSFAEPSFSLQVIFLLNHCCLVYCFLFMPLLCRHSFSLHA